MASSNRHWPSMFKTKPWQHDISSSFISNGCQKTPYSSGNEERTPEPKPRWNPRPEQIRILEAIFNSGMVNPPRDEIRKIRAQLQEYGQVGDANVFYWFQNRKSRSKHKQRHLQKPKYSHPHHPPLPLSSFHPPAAAPPPSSSSSSSDKCNPNSMENSVSLLDAANSHSPTPSLNNQLPYFQNPQNELMKVPFLLPFQPTGGSNAQGFCFSNATNYVSHLVDESIDSCSSSFLLSDLFLMNNHGVSSKKSDVEKMTMQQTVSYSSSTAASNMSVNQATVSPTTTAAFSTINHHTQGGIGETGLLGRDKSTVFINDVAFEVTIGLFNVREAFGDDAMLITSSGQPLLTDEWGITLQPLQHGSFYYLIRTLSPSTLDATFTLV